MNLPRDYLSEHVDTFKNKYDELTGMPAGLEFPPEPEMGDFAIALPMRAADPLGKSPREIGRDLAEHLRKHGSGLAEVSVAGPGFVNCRFKDEWLIDSMGELLDRSGLPYPEVGEGERVLLEFVSANPTGPLHVGHGRGAIYGDVLARLLPAMATR